MRVGIDVGGTHTDAALLDGPRVVATGKVLTSENVRDGVVNALNAVLADSGIDPTVIEAVMIGTTQFTNAVVERRGLAPTAIIRVALPSGELVPPMIDWPDDLASALGRHVYMIHGGRTYDGFPIAELSDEEIDRVAGDLAATGIELVAVSAVFSPSDPSQEQYVADRLKRRLPAVRVTPSHAIGRLGLLERENAALLNASLLPLADRVVDSLKRALADSDVGCPFYISQNDGTLMSADYAATYPALTFASGPTNSLRGASLLTRLEDAVVVDIGGTTTDIGVLQRNFPRQSNVAIEVGGVRTNFRMPDILSTGLGGGSIVLDAGRTIGPQSVGYRLVEEGLVFGGDTLTTTDIAVAAGAAMIGEPKNVASLDAGLVETATTRIHQMVDDGIDRMRSSREPVNVILVGGGAVLVSRRLPTAAAIHRPPHYDVANAIGAANAQVGSEVERIVSYRRMPRETVLEDMQNELAVRLAKSGVDPESVRLADIEETPVSYMADVSTRVRVKMVGDLAFGKRRAE